MGEVDLFKGESVSGLRNDLRFIKQELGRMRGVQGHTNQALRESNRAVSELAAVVRGQAEVFNNLLGRIEGAS